jgi:hypothetical protein
VTGGVPAAKLRRPRMRRSRRRNANSPIPRARILKTKDGYIQGYHYRAAVLSNVDDAQTGFTFVDVPLHNAHDSPLDERGEVGMRKRNGPDTKP